MGIVCACLPTLAGLISMLQISARATSMYRNLHSSSNARRPYHSSGPKVSEKKKHPSSESRSNTPKRAFPSKQLDQRYGRGAEICHQEPASTPDILDTTTSGDSVPDCKRNVYDGKIATQIEMQQNNEPISSAS